MILHAPIIITPRLLPGVEVGNAYLSIRYSSRPGVDGRIRYRYFVDLPGGTIYSNNDLQSGCDGGDLVKGLASLMSFLSACGESVEYRSGEEPSENANLFPPAVGEWCAENNNELSSISVELEEVETILIEE